MKFAICNEIFQNWKLEDAMRFAADTGYEGIEIAPFTIANYVTDIPKPERLRIRELATATAIPISGIHWVLVNTEGLHLTDPDADSMRRTSRYFEELVDFCADLGGKYIVIGSPRQRSLIGNTHYEQACEVAVQVLKGPTTRAEERDVLICFEPLAPSETNFINTAAQAVEFAKWMKSPNFKIILDVKAMCSESLSIPDIIRNSSGWVAHFHANDKNLKGPGFGDVDFRPIARALKEMRYDGYVSVEVFNFEEGPEMIATRSLQYLKASFLP